MSVAMLRCMAREPADDARAREVFRAWRARNQLTTAAAALGLSRRMIAYYDSGEREIPKTVRLACDGWETTRKRAA